MTKQEQIDQMGKRVIAAADTLVEHCTTVVVMTVFDLEDGERDHSYFAIRGGHHAAVGLAEEFLDTRRRARTPFEPQTPPHTH